MAKTARKTAKKPAPKAKKATVRKQPKRLRSVKPKDWPTLRDPITGRNQRLYTAEYRHKGATWGLDFWADDAKDATAKIKSIRAGLTMLGVLQGASK